MTHFLFYLLLLSIPLQLSRHFFFDFASISGIYSDYLTPILYLTDIIILLTIGTLNPKLLAPSTKQIQITKHQKPNNFVFRIWNLKFEIFFLVICYLLFNTIFIAFNKWAALYKASKIIELALLGIAISKLKPKLKMIVAALSISVFYSSFLAIWQFVTQQSIGGIFWWLGERTFSVSTPGIATFSPPTGGLLLRPYATFPHPNVLGGFLAVVLPFILYYSVNNPNDPGSNSSRNDPGSWQRFWLVISLAAGFTALILSFSRVAWLVMLFGLTIYFLEKKNQISVKISLKKEMLISIFYLFIGASIMLPLVSPDFSLDKYQYWQERVELIKTTIPMILTNLFFGVGLNNSIIQAQKYADGFPGLYIFQPVHNIYLLILAETGLIGFLFFTLITLVIINKALKSKSIFLYPFLQLLTLGLFDHYLFTLQQGQLLFVIFAALIFIKKMA